MDVAVWLQGLGLEQYEALFRENDIDAEVLSDLTDALRPSTAAHSNRITPPHRGRSRPECINSNWGTPGGSC